MNILCRTRPQVKPTRITPRPATQFGAGILPTYPTHRLPVLVSDLEWWAQESNTNTSDFSPDDYYDALADEAALASAMLDRYTQGWL
jgi:hypothetical protein